MHFFVKPGAQGLLPILCHTSERWNQIQRDTPEQTEESLKLVLLKALLLELGQRLKNFLGNEESQKAARDMGGKPGPRNTLIAETIELRKLINPETVFAFNH